MIYESILAFRAAVEEKGGKVIQITFDRKGYRELANEIDYPFAKKLAGIVIERADECPTCGQELENK